MPDKLANLSFAVLLAFAALAPARGDEKLKDIACRSVHLAYDAPEGVAFYNEVVVDQSADGTYFCVCGFNQGYFGIQELGNGKKVVIFSIWEPGKQNDPKAVPEEQRVKLLHQGEGVRIGRFGNEGTGGQSFLDYDWKLGETLRFLVTAKVNGERSEFAGYFFLNSEKKWRHMVTFSTLAKGKQLGGYYAFVEDFRRNRISATKTRTARYTNGSILTNKGEWIALANARFTADSNPATNIDAGPSENGFFLSTGGEVKNEHVKLRDKMQRKAAAKFVPEDVVELVREQRKE